MFMGLVLEVASCTSVYKQAPEQVYFNGGLVVYVDELVLEVASCTSVYKQAPETNSFNGVLVFLCL